MPNSRRARLVSTGELSGRRGRYHSLACDACFACVRSVAMNDRRYRRGRRPGAAPVANRQGAALVERVAEHLEQDLSNDHPRPRRSLYGLWAHLGRRPPLRRSTRFARRCGAKLSARRYLIVRIAVADTHAAVWYLSADPRLSEWARRYLDAAAARGDQIVVSVTDNAGDRVSRREGAATTVRVDKSRGCPR